MTSDIGDIRLAVKKTLSRAGLNVYETIEDVVNSPAVMIEPHQSDYNGAMGMAADYYEFNLFVLVARKNTREAQHTLDALITGKGPKSIREFVWHNSDLGLGDVDANVTGVLKGTYNGSFAVSTISYVGAVMRLCVTIIG